MWLLALAFAIAFLLDMIRAFVMEETDLWRALTVLQGFAWLALAIIVVFRVM